MPPTCCEATPEERRAHRIAWGVTVLVHTAALLLAAAGLWSLDRSSRNRTPPAAVASRAVHADDVSAPPSTKPAADPPTAAATADADHKRQDALPGAEDLASLLLPDLQLPETAVSVPLPRDDLTPQ